MIKGLGLVLLGALWAGSCCGSAAAAKVEWTGERLLDVVYKQVDGREIKMDIYLPPSGKPDQAPVLYYVHGGGWAAGSKDKNGLPLMRPVFELMAEKGAVCVSIDYRLCRKDNGILVRDCVTDAMDGLRFLRKEAARFGIDPARIVVWGDSAGGQLAQMLALADPARFSGAAALAGFDVQPIAGISWYGPTDFTDPELFKTELSDANPDRFGWRISGRQGGAADFSEAYEEMSPYYWISRESPPLLLMQGDQDATIPYAHAPHLKAKADEVGAAVEMVIVQNAGHNWRNAGGRRDPDLQEIQRLTASFALRQIAAVHETAGSGH